MFSSLLTLTCAGYFQTYLDVVMNDEDNSALFSLIEIKKLKYMLIVLFLKT
jgi:hypothetical protein